MQVVQGTVVQGAPVQNNVQQGNVVYGTSAPTGSYVAPNSTHKPPFPPSGSTTLEDKKQPNGFRDVGFSIAFFAHLVVIVILMFTYGGSIVFQNNGGDSTSAALASIVVVCGLFGAGISAFSFGLMMTCATQLVKMALFFSIGMNLAIAVASLLAGQLMMAGLGFLAFVVSICYAFYVWARVPFAAANLNTALTAVRMNMGLTFVAYFFMGVSVVWSLVWTVAAGGAMSAWGQGSLFFFLLSFYWTLQVIQNVIHVTSAGTIGTWWFTPSEANSFFSPGLRDSMFRATSYSFGSICFGSLIVAFVKALRQLAHMARDNDECQVLLCLVDCLLGCLEEIIEYFNKWAYVYVGLYGYSYLEAGKNVMQLFQNKGWTTIITDDLVENVLFMVSVGIGLITGLLGYGMALLHKQQLQNAGFDDIGLMGFIIGLLVGFLLSSIVMSVISSAVNTIIVLFAEAPMEFQHTHPELSGEMRAAWRQAWPGECGF